MGAEKTVRTLDATVKKYDRRHRQLVQRLRFMAIPILEFLDENNLPSFIHGSVARGDVSKHSDVDLVIPSATSTSALETIMSLRDYHVYSRALVQATPSHVPKAHIYFDPEESICLTVPLAPLRTLEFDFYRFGGLIDLPACKGGERVPGCTKRLTLIEPTPSGHMESTVVGREDYVAKVLNVHPEIVRERVRVLTRRDRIGRTGVFLKSFLKPNETFEEHLKWLTDRNPAVRRLLTQRS